MLLPKSSNRLIFARWLCKFTGFHAMLPVPGLGVAAAESLPRDIPEFKKLQEFSISNNKLIFLPMQLFHLTKLKVLRADDNKLEFLSNNNKLSQFPNALCALFDLKPLNLSDKSISEIIPGISDIKDLEHLELNKNKLSSFSHALMCSIMKLVCLDISENGIKSMQAVMSETKALQVLLLYHNKFHSFPEELCSLKCLKTLDVSNN
ncbi:LOW QUALITY PROTEIN: uncharacterized protein RG961_004377 [Leptosomus discolor]